MIARRAALAGFGSLLLSAPVAGAPQSRTTRIGWIALAPISGIAELRAGMAAHGHVEGKTYVLIERYGDAHRLAEIMNELPRLSLDVLVVNGGTVLGMVLRANPAQPIVAVGSDIARVAGVGSVARPGGNMTGIEIHALDLGPKWLDLAKEAFAPLRRVGILVDASTPRQLARIEAIAPSLGLVAVPAFVQGTGGFERAFRTLIEQKVEAVVVTSSTFFISEAKQIVAHVERFRLRAVYEQRIFAEAGGLIAYGVDRRVPLRRAADFVHRIINGTKAGDIPIESAVKIELVVNLRTARALGVAIPPAILLRADEVIE